MAQILFRAQCRQSRRDSDDPRASLVEKLPQNRAMAMRFAGAVAADGEVRVMRQRRECIEKMTRIRRLHLCPEPAHERTPRSQRGTRARGPHQLLTRREIRKPDVVPVLGSVSIARDSTRRTPYRSQPHTLPSDPRRTELDDPDAHDAPSSPSNGWLTRKM